MKTALYLTVIFALYCVAGTMDYADQVRDEAPHTLANWAADCKASPECLEAFPRTGV